jgi:hypothetical protein
MALPFIVALICDKTEGLAFLANFRLVQEAFENPELAADREHARAVLGYLSEDSISAMPFHRLAGADTGRASQLFRRLLNEPGFSWERDGESLLRKHKPRCFGAKPLPLPIWYADCRSARHRYPNPSALSKPWTGLSANQIPVPAASGT